MSVGLLGISSLVAFTGQWAKDGEVDIRFLIGVIFLAILLAGLGEVNAELANAFLALMLIALTTYYGPSILDNLGLT